MNESLISRVKRLVSGAVFDSIDAVEAAMPEATMREAIREIERTIEDVREELRKVEAARHIAGKRIQLSQDKISDLQKKIETGLGAGREDLAQAAIERVLDLEAQIPVLNETANEAGARIAELGSYVAALRGRKAEMDAELKAFSLARAQTASEVAMGEIAGADNSHEKRAEKAEQAFDRVMKNATGVEGIGRSDRETVSKLVELEGIERQKKIADRLDAYRREHAAKANPAA